MHTAPRRCSLTLLELRLYSTEKIHESETGYAGEEIALVLEDGVGWEVCADREEEDGEVQ